MNFSDLFRNIDHPVLICKDDEQLSVCYGNESAILLLGRADAATLCDCSLQSLLALSEEEIARLRSLLAQRGECKEVRSSIGLLSGGRMQVHLAANRLCLQDVSYVKLCLTPPVERTPTIRHGSILLSAVHAAHEMQSAQQAMDRMLAVLGAGLQVERICVFESADDNTISSSYEWCAEEVRSKGDLWQDIPSEDLYDILMDGVLPGGRDNRIFTVGDERVIAASESLFLLSVPILWHGALCGYLIAEDATGRSNFTKEDLCLLEEIADIVAFFLRRREQERKLHYKLDVLNTVANHFDGMICVHDLESEEILFANRELSEELGIPLSELRGRSGSQLMQELDRRESECCPKDTGECRWEFQNPKSGKWYLARRSQIKWIDGRRAQVDRMVDISEQKAHESALEQIASMDMMTGVYKREWGRRLIEHILEQPDREDFACLVFLDLDKLKCVNDRFGHSEGDQMIKQTVKMIQSHIRKTDVICRWGGDEFLIVIRATEKKTIHIMEKIRERMEEHNARQESCFRLSFSYGVVEIVPGKPHSLENLIAEADQKMYYDKLSRFCK